MHTGPNTRGTAGIAVQKEHRLLCRAGQPGREMSQRPFEHLTECMDNLEDFTSLSAFPESTTEDIKANGCRTIHL